MAAFVEAEETTISRNWKLILPAWRAAFHHDEPYWEFARVDAMSRVIKPGMTVVDVGAEVGDYSALFQKWIGDEGNLVLVEPVAKVWPSIRQIFRLNHLKAPIKSFVGFAGAEYNPGDASRADDYCDPKVRTGWPAAADREVLGEPGFQHLNENDSIPQRTLTDIVGVQLHVDVISMDTEGSELEVLHGAQELIERDHPVVFVSIHHHLIGNYGHKPSDVYDFMTSLGYRYLRLANDHESHVVFMRESPESILL